MTKRKNEDSIDEMSQGLLIKQKNTRKEFQQKNCKLFFKKQQQQQQQQKVETKTEIKP